MTNNKSYKWFRTCLYLLPFAVLALVLFNTDFTAVTDLYTTISGALQATADVLPLTSFEALFSRIFSDIFGADSTPVWFTAFLSYYVLVYLVDIAFALLLFLPRWINSKFGGEWLD